MVCKAEGSPEPWVEWRRDNQQVGDAFGHSEAVLVLRAGTRTDSGLYTCLAQNAVGTVVPKYLSDKTPIEISEA